MDERMDNFELEAEVVASAPLEVRKRRRIIRIWPMKTLWPFAARAMLLRWSIC